MEILNLVGFASVLVLGVKLFKTVVANNGNALTEWDEFRDLDCAGAYNSMYKPAWVFDGRNVVDSAKLRSLGFYVYSIGKPEYS